MQARTAFKGRPRNIFRGFGSEVMLTLQICGSRSFEEALTCTTTNLGGFGHLGLFVFSHALHWVVALLETQVIS